ncbi:diguanylate cyclase [Clostridium sp.]|uniref:diguanylate cyclase n=1 Tax=Clostridium sp. TaxID=1506 RepID=UPI003216330E
MKMVNERYKIVELVNKSRTYSVYEAMDITKGISKVKLCIINTTHMEERLLKFCISELEKMGSIDNDTIIKILDFGVVIDETDKNNKRNYYYVTEWIGEYKSLLQFVDGVSEKMLIDIFVEICKMAYTQSYSYNKIIPFNAESIYITSNIKPKLKDKITIMLEYREIGITSYDEENSDDIATGEINKYTESNYYIEKLSEILVDITTRNQNKYRHIKSYKNIVNGLNEVNNNECKDVGSNKIYMLLNELRESSEGRKVKNIFDIIRYINELYGTNYKYEANVALENLNFSIPLIEREEEVNLILEAIENIEKFQQSKNIILVHGEIGIGKSRLLEHIKHRINIKENKEVKSSGGIYIISNKVDSSKLTIEILLEKIVEVADNNLINKYKKDLVKFLPQINGEGNLGVLDVNLLDSKSKLVLILKISSFLQEYYSKNIGIIIMDDMSIYDDFTLSIIQQVLSKPSIHRNLAIVLAYRDGDCLKNNKFIELIGQLSERVSLDVHLRTLSEDKVGTIIKNILNVSHVSEEFLGMFYRYSSGNPLFIEEALKDLITRKIIYINKDTGKWNRIKGHEIFMSLGREKICKSQLSDLDKLSYEVLYIMSFFYMPISIDMIKQIINVDEENINNTINELVSKGILYSSIGDNGFVYSFYNKFLKNYLYRTVDNTEKMCRHNEISQMLINCCKGDLNVYLEETIYQLDIIGDKEKLIYYYKKNEERLEAINNSKEAIKCNIKILDILDTIEDRFNFIQDEIEANVNLGKLYNKLSQKTISLKYYENALKLCNVVNEVKTTIDIMSEMATLYRDLSNNKKVIYYTHEISKLLKSVNYVEGEIKYLIIEIRNSFFNQDFKKLELLTEYGIQLCKENYLEYKLMFLNSYCNALIDQNKIKEALDTSKEIIKECSNNNYTSQLIRAYNSVGLMYSDYIQCPEEALEWFMKLYKVKKSDSDRAWDITSGANIGFVNYVLLNYDEAYKYLIESVNKAIQEQFVYLNLYSYIYLGTVLFKQGKYLECFRYVDLCTSYIDANSASGQELSVYYIFLYYVNNLLGESKKAEDCLIKGKNILGNSDSVIKHKVQLLYIINNAIDNNGDISTNDIIEASEKILYIDLRVSMLCEHVIRLLNNEEYLIASEMYTYMNKLRESVKSNINKLTLDYIGCKLNIGVSVADLAESTRLYNDVTNPMLMWRVYGTIAYSYYSEFNYVYATKYFLEACNIILEILGQISKNNRKSFLKRESHMIKYFEILLYIKSYYNNEVNMGEMPIDLNLIDNIEEVLKIILESDFINEKFINEARKLNSDELKDVNSIEDLVNNLHGNSDENIEFICKYINSITLASKTKIVVENNNKFSVISSNIECKELPEDMTLVNISRNKGIPLRVNRGLIKDSCGNILSHEAESYIKSSMCIPIAQVLRHSSRGSKYEYNQDIIGYIYIECDSKLNNISEDTMNKCITIGKILYMIIDKLNIKKSSTIDRVTNTLTRKYLETFVHEQIELSSTHGYEFSTLMVDIDKFKHINDTFGHRMGDKVLSKLCDVMIKNIRKDDVVGRYGGEEFIIVLPYTGITEAETIAERIRVKIYEAKIMGDKQDVTVSIGIANYPNHTTNYEELIEKSDQALYAAKNNGRNNTKIWNEYYESKISTTNRLSGILVGSGNQDYKNVSTVIEFIDLINDEISIEEKLMISINRIAEITEADLCTIFKVENDELEKIYSKIVDVDNNSDVGVYNYDNVKVAIKTGENLCAIDWEHVEEFKNVPDVKSKMIVLLKNKSKIIGVIYLAVSINNKEFTHDELNFVNTLAKIISPILSYKE